MGRFGFVEILCFSTNIESIKQCIYPEFIKFRLKTVVTLR